MADGIENSEKKIEEKENPETEIRDSWPNHWEFFLSCLGYAIGLGMEKFFTFFASQIRQKFYRFFFAILKSFFSQGMSGVSLICVIKMAAVRFWFHIFS